MPARTYWLNLFSIKTWEGVPGRWRRGVRVSPEPLDHGAPAQAG